MRWFPSVATTGLILLSSMAASAQMPSRERALQAPVGELAQDMLAALAPRLVEVSRPNFTGMRGPDAPIGGLRFATQARSAGNPGMCAATVVDISPEDTDYSPINTREVYKVVASTAPLPDMWNDDYDAWLKGVCANTRPVIAATTGDFSSPRFFTIDGFDPNDAWVGARVLELAIAEAQAGLLNVECADGPNGRGDDDGTLCAEGGAIAFGRLKLDTLRSVAIAPCEDDKAKRCLNADLLREGSESMELLWHVTLEVTEGLGRDGYRDVEAPSQARMAAGWVIYD